MRRRPSRPQNFLLLEVNKLDNDQLRLAVFRSRLQGNEMNNGQQESNTHIVNEINRHNHAFIKTETQVSLQTSRPHGRFRVMLFTMCCRYFIEHFVYNNFFGLLSHELIWQGCERDQLSPDHNNYSFCFVIFESNGSSSWPHLSIYHRFSGVVGKRLAIVCLSFRYLLCI